MGEAPLERRYPLLDEGREDRGEKLYRRHDKILLVGEGDFSFSASLAKTFGSAANMVATSHDSKELLKTKHWSAAAHLEELKALGCRVLHGIDVNDMNKQRILKTMKFDRIVFNFPHAGHDPSLHERDGILIQRHKDLVSAFFNSARKMLRDGGEVHVTHREDYPYCRWKLKKLAKKSGLVLKERVEFRKADYPGYHNKRGGGIRSNQKFPLGNCFTFKFQAVLDSSSIHKNGPSSSACEDVSEALSDLHL